MFKTERELINIITANRANLFSFTNWNDQAKTEILDELDLGYGVADLVVAKYSVPKIKRTEPLNYDDIFICKILEKKGALTFGDIREITRTSERKLRNTLNKLRQEGFIWIKGIKYQTKKRRFKEIEAIAIEAKLRNWKRALKQAYRYKWFASYSYVVMDATHVRPALENRYLFKKFNVGLASITKDGTISIQFRPQKIKPIDEIMHFLLAEHLYFRTQK